jgi:hypothetical protein
MFYSRIVPSAQLLLFFYKLDIHVHNDRNEFRPWLSNTGFDVFKLWLCLKMAKAESGCDYVNECLIYNKITAFLAVLFPRFVFHIVISRMVRHGRLHYHHLCFNRGFILD